MRTNLVSSVFAAGIAVMLATTAVIAGEKTPQGDADDTALALSRGVKTNIEQKEQEIVQNELAVFQAIDQAMEKLQNNNLEGQQETLEEFHRMCGILSALAHKLLANRSKIVTDADQLNQLNMAAVPIFRKTAVQFQDYSREEPFDEIKQDYLVLADAWNALADLMEKRATRFTDENKELVEAIHFVERTALFLDRFKKHLDSLPNLQEFSDREHYLEQMRHYIKGFERFREQFRKFDTTLRSQAISANLRPKNAAKHPCDIIDKGPAYAKQIEESKATPKAIPAATPLKKAVIIQTPPEDKTAFSLFPTALAASCAIGLVVVPLRKRKPQAVRKTQLPPPLKSESYQLGYVVPRPEPSQGYKAARVSSLPKA